MTQVINKNLLSRKGEECSILFKTYIIYMDKLIKANTRTLRSPLWTLLIGVHMDQKFKIKVLKPYDEWFKALPVKDKNKVAVRISMVQLGHFGHSEPVRGKVKELKFGGHGGLRVYYSIRKHNTVVLLLAGGNKGTQDADIKKAVSINKETKDEDI